MNVLLLMLAGSDTSRDAHKVLLGVLPELSPAIMEEVDASSLRCHVLFLTCSLLLAAKSWSCLWLPPGIVQEMSSRVL